MSPVALRDEPGRVARCEGCERAFPAAELRRFRRVDASPATLCLGCAAAALEAQRVDPADASARARLTDLVVAALAVPAWGATPASEAQRARLRRRTAIASLMRVTQEEG